MYQNYRFNLFLFLASEAVIFFFFFSILGYRKVIAFDLYVGITPALLILQIYLNDDLRKTVRQLLLSKDIIIFLSVLTIWVYIFALQKLDIGYIFSTLYYPVILEELNFRFVVINSLKRWISFPRAVIIQAFLYAFFYSSYLIFEPHSYPGIYGPLFVVDMISMGLLYGAIFFIRKNLYIDLSIHLSLWVMAAVLPPLFAWIPYTMAPT